jgi:hypothetical protein
LRPAELTRELQLRQAGKEAASTRPEIEHVEQRFLRRGNLCAVVVQYEPAEQFGRQSMERDDCHWCGDATWATECHGVDDRRNLFDETVMKKRGLH